MSDPVEIPVSRGTPLFSQRVTLDGIEYLFSFDWNDRETRWYLSIKTINETSLALGIKLVANINLLRRFSDPSLPKGFLIAADLSNPYGEPPTFAELGARVRVFYFPPD